MGGNGAALEPMRGGFTKRRDRPVTTLGEIRDMKRRRLLATPLLLLPALLHAQANGDAPRRRYAVISLVGDKMYVVVYQTQTGTTLDANRRESVSLGDSYFDAAALLAAEAAVGKAEPGAAVALLRARSASLYEMQDKLIEGSKLVVPDELADALQESRATHLILFTKYRTEARLRELHGTTGAGKLEGLGYYVDPVLHMRRSDTGEHGIGFLAPYVYIKAALIDLASLKLLDEVAITASTTLSAARNKHGTDPWTTLSSTEKLEHLRSMLTREIERVVPALVAVGNERH